MLYEFKSRATGSVTMTGDVGKTVLSLIGRGADAQGIITVAQMPAAIAALEAAMRSEPSANQSAGGGGRDTAGDAAADDPADDEEQSNPVGIGQRVFPLIEMLRRAQAAGKDVTWGV